MLTSFPILDADVWTLLARHGWAIGSIAIGSVFLVTLLSTVKWQMLLKLAAVDLAQPVKFDQAFAYTAASVALAQIVPSFIAGPGVRGAAMKLQHEVGFARSAMLAGYEQVFDVLVLLIGGIAALSLLLGGMGGHASVAALIAILALTAASVYALPNRFRPAKLAAVLPRRWHGSRFIRESVEAGSSAGLDAPRVLGHLTAISALRYVILLGRTLGIGLFLVPLVPWETLALAFGAVQLSALVALTPGNLGISELGWSAITMVTDQATAGELVAFALALRLSGLAASTVQAVLALLWLRQA